MTSSKQYTSPPPMTIDASQRHTATLETSEGTITIELDASRSPNAVNNFVFLANENFYDGVVFHRCIKGFMIQGGDPTGTGSGGPGYRFADELDGPGGYPRGTVAMANAGPNTNGSQFFVMHQDGGLPHSYTIFGKVTDGMEVVDTIATTATDRNDRPDTPMVINSVQITTA